jgi:lipoprotein signal peptidase
VTDFIDFPAWPTFNLADVSIVVGVMLLVLLPEIRSRLEPRDDVR